ITAARHLAVIERAADAPLAHRRPLRSARRGESRNHMTIAEFGEGVRIEIADCLSPAVVSFRGSFASGTFDECSDVDLRARVQMPLDADFFVYLAVHST